MAELEAGTMRWKTFCRRWGSSRTSVERWIPAYRQTGFHGLLSECAESGRESVAEKLRRLCGPEEFEQIRKRVQAMNYDYKSNSLAWRRAALALPDGHPVRTYMEKVLTMHTSKHAIAQSLRIETSVDPAQRLLHRGRKALKLGGYSIPRKCDVLPGDIYVMDDETENVICAVPAPKCDKYPFGWKAMQAQVFPCLDFASQYCGAWFMVARERSSYRGTDLWGGIGHCIDAMRLPRLGFQFERGTWESNILRGVKVDYLPGEPSATQRMGGLQMLPSNILDWHREQSAVARLLPPTLTIFTSYTPKSKPIEGWFNRSQRLRQAFWGYAGRDQRREPQERIVKLFNACKRGAENPAEHFMTLEELEKAYGQSVMDLNADRMEGEVFSGVPSETWNEWVNKPGFELKRMHPEMAWMYRGMWAQGTVKGPFVRVRLTDELTRKRFSLFWQNATELSRFDGKTVAVYWDAKDHTLPAYVVDPRSAEFVCDAAHLDRVGAFLDDDMTGLNGVKQWEKFHTAIYGAIKSEIPSLQMPDGVRERRRDGRAAEAHPIEEPSSIAAAGKISNSEYRRMAREETPIEELEKYEAANRQPAFSR